MLTPDGKRSLEKCKRQSSESRKAHAKSHGKARAAGYGGERFREEDLVELGSLG